jgi:hypothetical protein
LSQFTPDGAGLDRDGLFFAAGRASVRLSRKWIALIGALILTQGVTLAFLFWPPPPHVAPVPDATPTVAAETPSPRVGDQAGMWTDRESNFGADNKMFPNILVEPMIPAQPPLRAFGPLPADLLQ